MRFIWPLLFIVLIPSKDNTFDEFTKNLPSGWLYEVHEKELTIRKDSVIEIKYCGISPLRREQIYPLHYAIMIIQSDKLSETEIKNRKEKQEQILDSYRKVHNKIGSKSSFVKLNDFEFRRNKIDSLRLPFYSDEQYSYFMDDNLPYCHCILKDSIKIQLDAVRNTILNR